MAKTKLERITNIDEEIKQLENLKKQLLQQHKEQERKARTRRLIERGAIIESLIPGAAEMANDDFMAYLQQYLITSSVLPIPQSEPQGNSMTKTEIGGGSA